VQVKDDRKPDAAKVEAAMQAEVEKWYKNLAANGEIDEAGNIKNLPLHQAELEKILRPHIVQMFEAGSLQGAMTVGTTVDDAFSIYPDRAIGFLSQYTIRLSRELTATAQNYVRDAIMVGFTEGESLSVTTAKVREALGEQATWRAERIARTETRRAQEEGNLESWRALGIEGKVWQLGPNPCVYCEAMSKRFNSAMDINRPFLSPGDTFEYEGGAMVIDRTINSPPLHPNCECSCGPVMRLGE
jgi:hypothetical protein